MQDCKCAQVYLIQDYTLLHVQPSIITTCFKLNAVVGVYVLFHAVPLHQRQINGDFFFRGVLLTG